MKKNYDDNELDRLFRDNLGGEEAAPSPRVWDNIGKELDADRRRPSAWKWWLSGLVLVAGLGGWLGFSLWHSPEKTATTGWDYNNPKNSAFEMQADNKSNVAIKDNAHDSSAAGSADKIASAQTANEQHAVNSNEQQDPKTQQNVAVNSDNQKNVSVSENGNAGATPNVDAMQKAVKNYGRGKGKLQHDGDGDYHPSAQAGAGFTPDYVQTNWKTNVLHNESKNGSTKEFSGDPETKSPPEAESQTGKTVRPSLDSIHKEQELVQESTNVKVDSAPQQEPVVEMIKKDSATVKNDSTTLPGTDLPPPAKNAFPSYFVAAHAAYDQGKVYASDVDESDYGWKDVKVYNPNKLESVPQQTYSYGMRFGKFVTKRISVTGGVYYSIFESRSGEGFFKFDHNEEYDCHFHTSTSTVELSSDHFVRSDSYGGIQNDTFYIGVRSNEQYDYLNFQLGVSYYAIRTKHFGVYADLLSNGAYLAKEQMRLTIPQSGHYFMFSGEQMSGMNKFVMGGQAGVGFEYMPIRSIGIWMEPSFYFSGGVNKENSVVLHPYMVRYMFGLTYHF